jgi:hypothetical protein
MLNSDELAYEAGDLVVKLYQPEGDDEEEFARVLQELPPHWGTLEAMMYYDSMVNNGGHHQYFWNSQGAYINLVETGLELYGAKHHLGIFRSALELLSAPG